MTDSCQDNEEADDTIKYRLEEFKRRAINLHDARAMREEVERRIRDELTLEQVWEAAESVYWNWWAE